MKRMIGPAVNNNAATKIVKGHETADFCVANSELVSIGGGDPAVTLPPPSPKVITGTGTDTGDACALLGSLGAAGAVDCSAGEGDDGLVVDCASGGAAG